MTGLFSSSTPGTEAGRPVLLDGKVPSIGNESPLLGEFREKGECFVLTHPTATRRPWVNCCYNENFYINCDQFGRSMSQAQGPAGEWALPVIARDEYAFSGDKGIFIRDEETGAYWDAGWAYTQREFDHHEVEMRPGEVAIRHRYLGIEVDWELLVAGDDPVECWEIRVRNLEERPRTLSLFPFQLADMTGYAAPAGSAVGRIDSYLCAFIDRSNHAVVCRNVAPFIQFDRYGLMLASDLKPASYETLAEEFLGLGRQFARPAAMRRPRLSDREARGQQCLAALQITVELAPGEKRTARVIAAAVGREAAEYKRLVAKYLTAGGLGRARAQARERTKRLRGGLKLESPDAYVNALASYWLPQQAGLCARFSRGWGMGYRDSLQDAMALMLVEAAGPEAERFAVARRILEGCLRSQYRTGGTPRKWRPLSREDYSDGPAWLVDAVTAYVRASGDAGFLDRGFPFLDGEPAPVHEHVRRAVAFMLDDRGAHGLVRIRGGDWNDGITGAGSRGEGESVLNTLMLLENLGKLESLLPALADPAARAGWSELIAAAGTLRQALQQQAWDGRYFRRAFDDEGRVVGGAANREGKIFLEPQAYALLADAVEGGQARQIVQSVEDLLETPYGCRLLAPSYAAFDAAVGRVSGHVPGMWENGAVYCHATAFYIHGLCRHGFADKAFDLFLRLTGGNPRHPAARSGVEPYAMTNCYCGPENESQPGAARFYWFTGTAGWALRYLAEALPGVTTEVGGVRVGRPAFPSHWNGAALERVIRGRRYRFEYARDASLARGAVEVRWHGRAAADGWLADAEAGDSNRVDVRFG